MSQESAVPPGAVRYGDYLVWAMPYYSGRGAPVRLTMCARGCEIVADLNRKCCAGQASAVLQLLRAARDEGVLTGILRADSTRGPLVAAVNAGSSACLRHLLEFGANPDVSDTEETPLLVACEDGGLAMVNLLLSAGANAVGVPAALHRSRHWTRYPPPPDRSEAIMAALLAHGATLPKQFPPLVSVTTARDVICGHVWDDDEAAPVVPELDIDDDYPFLPSQALHYVTFDCSDAAIGARISSHWRQMRANRDGVDWCSPAPSVSAFAVHTFTVVGH